MNNLTSLFLSQSYQDTWEDYNRSLSSENFPKWDYIILTASNENQAAGYRSQIESRKDFLPTETHFAVIPDEGNVRVGSGGATLSVLRYIYQREEKLKGMGSFAGLRILVIHSGGDSKRVPTYSALGKLFSPVPHKLPNGKSSTLFDEFLIAMSSVPSRICEGMLLLSGDVLLLFNPLQIDFPGKGAAAISFKENVETGKNHGVFLNSENGNVKKFLHKQTVETLREMGAVNSNDCVDIDTGAVIFSTDMLASLYSLISTTEDYHKYVNDTVRLSLYGDFLYPLAEDSTLEQFYDSKAVVGKNVILSYIDIHDEQIPDNVVLHGLKQKNGKFVCRIYGVEDNPKENRLFGMNLEEALEKVGIHGEEVWDQDEHLLWFAKIYPECESIREAVEAALNLFGLLHGDGNISSWKNTQRKSLCSGFNDADASAIIAWNKRMDELVRMDEIAKDIRYGKPAKETEALAPLTKLQENWLKKRLGRADFSEAVRLNYYIGTALGNRQGDKYIAESFKTISGQILEATLHNLEYNDTCKIVSEKHTVKLPLRVNWGGGWSDTPPICCEMGGTVLNAAISLNGELPVEVTLIKIPEKKIIFDSRDMDVHGEFDSIEELQRTGDPYDPFALQKACLLACGIIPAEGGRLDEILTRLGGGFEMHSEVTNVPKGSGLGTSSILSAACVKAVFEFMGITYKEEELYAHVLVMEQIMSTGGGWQDQVGGVTNGIKYITSKPGLDQQLKVEHIELQPETKKELNERFCLIYTGQRRLARNLLRDVVGRYVGNEPDSLYALNEIQKVAALMRFELERGKIDEFASLLNYHWELSRKVDAGSTNTLIDQIFLSIEDLIDAKMVCGAGGGGFLQVILKKGVQKTDVHKRLKDVFQDNPVDVWNCEIM